MALTTNVNPAGVLNLRVGELVEVRSEAEILATLDENGELESLPFMPEMLQYCGQRLTVGKVAHKLCDTISRSGMRRMNNAVHLSGVRCDGSAHGGCQTACLIYWKEAWLRRVNPTVDPRKDPDSPAALRTSRELGPGRITLPLLRITTRKEPGPDGEERFSCQATELLRAAPDRLPFRDPSQYAQDLRSGNVGPLPLARTFLIGLFNRIQDYSTRTLPRQLRFRGGLRWGFLEGKASGKTPTDEIGLQPGELVRVKSKEAISSTLDGDLLNRGMGFEAEMARFCGREARVLRRVEQVIDERTGRMLRMKNPCIVLEDIYCEGAYSASCPRAFVPFWREIWLERVGEPHQG
jgi:hypothetical protein